MDKSHPSRMCGLKPLHSVVSSADAWIKISHDKNSLPSALSHPSQMRGLKPDEQKIYILGVVSHPSRMRGLK